MRPSSSEREASAFHLAHKLHMYILMASCERIAINLAAEADDPVAPGKAAVPGAVCDAPLLKSPWFPELPSRGHAPVDAGSLPRLCGGVLRIGHGVAFLAGTRDPVARFADNDLFDRLDDFRHAFLQSHKVVCELNPTSNHLLLGDTFVDDEARNVRVLRLFMKANLPVVLCTDDDGFWAIHKCREHYRHVSVAHELCQAIVNGDIESPVELRRILEDGAKASFAMPN